MARTTPDNTLTQMPPGIPYIIGNELAERFSFYGMRAILTVYMTTHLLDSSGAAAHMTEADASKVMHNFITAAYFFPIIGALLSDIFFGKYKTILFLSMGYCVGHCFLAMGDSGIGAGLMEPKTWLLIGLWFIAIGAGGIKPCVSAHVGDQFGQGNKGLLNTVFNWFYFSINVGSAISSALIPVLLDRYGAAVAFGVPGVLMALATLVFWMGRNSFVHIPPNGWQSFKQETLSPDGRRAIFNLIPIFLFFVPAFWMVFDQTTSAWVLQAQKMDLEFMGFVWLPSQFQAVNPILILTLIPLFTYVVYPAVHKVVRVTPLRKIGAGLFLTGLSFMIPAWVESRISAGETPNIGWQVVAYLGMTAAEVMVSITALEFAYTQAPKKIKSFIMGVFLLGVAVGNKATSLVLGFMINDQGLSQAAAKVSGGIKALQGVLYKDYSAPQTADHLAEASTALAESAAETTEALVALSLEGASPSKADAIAAAIEKLQTIPSSLADKEQVRAAMTDLLTVRSALNPHYSMLPGASYYWFFACAVLVAALLFVFYAPFYRGRTFIQGEDEASAAAHSESPSAP